MIQHRIGREGQIRAGVGDVAAVRGQPLHMGLVDDRVGHRRQGAAVGAPVIRRVHHDTARGEVCRIAGVERQVAMPGADVVAHQRVVPDRVAGDLLGIGVQQQLVRIEPVPFVGAVGAMRAVAVLLARRQARDMAVPDMAAVFGQVDQQVLVAVRIEQTQRHPRRILREHGKIHAFAVEACAHGPGTPRGHRDCRGHAAGATSL